MILFYACASTLLYRRRATEKYEFEKRQNNINSCSFRHFRPSMKSLSIVQNFQDFTSKNPSTDKNLSISTLLEKLNPTFSEKRELEFGDMTLFDISRL